MPMFRCLVSCWLGLTLIVPAAAQVPRPSPGSQQYAILLAVQQHQEERLNLAFTLRDAAAMRQVLIERGGVPVDNILGLTDGAAPEQQPTLANVRRAVPAFLKKLQKEDRLLVFFAGHGFVEKGRTFLLLRDSDPSQLAGTALPTPELRQWLDQCQAREKVLLLDCCHAGGARTIPPGSSAEEVARPLEDSSVVVLAGCARKQQSWEWNEQRQGVFSYWLCKGLEGGADENGDGKLNVDEVFKYVEGRVRHTAEAVLNRQQTPRRIIGAEVEGVPTLLTLRPEEPESLCRRLAAELDLHIRRHKRKKVIVLPDLLVPLGKKEGGSRASLPSFLAARVQQGLSGASRPDPKEPAAYEVLTEEQARTAARGFRFDDLGRKEELARLNRSGGLDVIISGTLRERGQHLHLNYELIDAVSGDVLDRAGGVLPVSATLLGMNGDNLDLVRKHNPDHRHPEVLAAITESRQQGHPLLKAVFPFSVEVVVVQAAPGEKITAQTPRQVRQPVVKMIDGKNALVMPFKKGEIYELRIHNFYEDNPVGVTVLVDGINALGQKRERLGKAWSWVLAAKSSMTVEGWSVPTSDASQPGKTVDFRVKRFQIVDVPDSVAGRQGFTDELGTITVAFFAEGARAVGTGEGPEEKRQFRTTNFRLGALLGVVHLYYIDAKELER